VFKATTPYPRFPLPPLAMFLELFPFLPMLGKFLFVYGYCNCFFISRLDCLELLYNMNYKLLYNLLFYLLLILNRDIRNFLLVYVVHLQLSRRLHLLSKKLSLEQTWILLICVWLRWNTTSLDLFKISGVVILIRSTNLTKI
jgi:hypothetical protein